MNKLTIMTMLVFTGMSTTVSADHAEDHWPEPIESYRTGQVYLIGWNSPVQTIMRT